MNEELERCIIETHVMVKSQGSQIEDLYNRLHGKDGGDGVVQELAALKKSHEDCRDRLAAQPARTNNAIAFAALCVSLLVGVLTWFKK